ncbi:MAG TPA: hypothetical protein VEQ63_00735 [Bryobacteraceae bacterium]|nr:hypothetical protein [Bryobacteraceae bacterium]
MASHVDLAFGKLAKAAHAVVGRIVPTILPIVVPPRFWYPAMLHLSGVLGPIHKLCSKKRYATAIHKAHLLQRFLALSTRTRIPFPIEWEASGTDLLASGDDSKGLILCSAHIPLVRMTLTAAVTLQAPVSAVFMVHPPQDGQIAVLGTDVTLPAVAAGPAVLLKARRMLDSGGWVMLLVDHYTGGDYSPNVFRFAGRMGARVVFFFVELQANGTVAIRFVSPPDPWCATDQGIEANLAALHAGIQNVLRTRPEQRRGRGLDAAELRTEILPD